jgi:hypothetical protein
MKLFLSVKNYNKNKFTHFKIIIYSTIIFIMLIQTQKVFSAIAEPKKLLILDVINIEGKSDYNYIEDMITSSIRKMLSKKFTFKENEREAIMKTAKKNLLFREDFYTQSVAMNLALLTRHDVVIGGGFLIRKGKKQDFIIIKLFIADLAQKKIIAKITEEGPAGSKIFETIEKISDIIAVKAKAVLPNEEEWKQQRMRSTPDAQITGGFGISPFKAPGKDKTTLGTSSYLVPGDFGLWYIFSAEYRRINLFMKNFVIWGRTNISYGKDKYPVYLNDEKASANFTGLDITAGAGYKFLFNLPYNVNAYLLPGTGAGYQTARISYDYSSLRYPPISNSKPVTQYQENRSTPTASLNIATGLEITESVTMEINSIYQLNFISGITGNFIFTIGAGYQW